jgi:enoyl-CoA hydratase/carnithine racemase
VSGAELIRLDVSDGVAWATIDAPPINLMTVELLVAITQTAQAVAADDGVRVLLWRSANPDFFIAHFDVEAILSFPIDTEPVRGESNYFHQMCETLRTMPKATICTIAGRVGGGGAEMAASCDMRFGAIGRTVLNQMEVPLGILPGGSGTQRIPRLVGRNRALEIILGGIDIDANTLADWGWLNRALPPDELDVHVARLARRIASFPATAIAEAKAAVLAAEPDPTAGLAEESWRFQRTIRTETAQTRMRRFLELGGQTRDVELNIADLELG